MTICGILFATHDGRSIERTLFNQPIQSPAKEWRFCNEII